MTITRNSILMLTSDNANKKEIEEIALVDETVKSLGTKAATADQYASLILEMPVYEGFDDLLLDVPRNLRATAQYWQYDTKPAMMTSVSKIRAFCNKYTNYFPELVEELENGSKTVAAEKGSILGYLGEILPDANQSITSLKETQGKSKYFLGKVEENRNILRSKVIPNIDKRADQESVKLVRNLDELYAVELDIEHANQQVIVAMGGTIASGVTLGLGVTLHIFRKQVNSVLTKLTPKVITKVLSKIAASGVGKIAGKAMPIISAVLILTDIVGLIASSIFWAKYKKELNKLLNKKGALVQENLNLNTDITYLKDMNSNFVKLLGQADEVANAFNALNTAWHNIYLSINEINSQLKDLNIQLPKKITYMKSKLVSIDREFSFLTKKLEEYEINFNLDIGIQDEIKILGSDEVSEFKFPTNFFIPNHLYSAYTKAYSSQLIS